MGDLGGPTPVHGRLFRSDIKEVILKRQIISVRKLWLESYTRCDFLFSSSVLVLRSVDKIWRSLLKYTTKYNVVWLCPFVSPSPP